MVECFSLKRVNPRMLLEEISDALLVIFEHSSIADVREVVKYHVFRRTGYMTSLAMPDPARVARRVWSVTQAVLVKYPQ